VDVGGGDDAEAEAGGEGGEVVGEGAIVGAVVTRQLDPEIVAEPIAEPAGGALGGGIVVGQERGGEGAVAAAGEAEESDRVLRQYLRRDQRVALGPRELGGGEEAAEGAPAVAILDEEGEVAAVGQGDLRAVDGADTDGVAGAVEGDRAVEARPVGEGEGGLAEIGGATGQRLGRGRAIEE